jgi:hypothetical protein
MLYSGFYAMRRRALFRRLPAIDARLQHALIQHYGSPGAVTRINPRVGRLLMDPNVVTAVAAKRAAA